MECFIKSAILKYILYICNAVFAIFGFLLAVVGIVMTEKIGDFTKYPHASDIKTLPTLVIVLGIYIVAVALIGCFGVYIEHTIVLTIYVGATFVMLILQLSMVLWIFVNLNKYPNSMSDLVAMAWLQNSPQNGYPMDILQIQFDCCGRYGSTDYTSAGLTVLNSCCGDWILADCPANVYLTKPGCQSEFHNFWTKNNDIIRFCGIVLVVAQFVALFFSHHFLRTLRNSNSN